VSPHSLKQPDWAVSLEIAKRRQSWFCSCSPLFNLANSTSTLSRIPAASATCTHTDIPNRALKSQMSDRAVHPPGLVVLAQPARRRHASSQRREESSPNSMRLVIGPVFPGLFLIMPLLFKYFQTPYPLLPARDARFPFLALETSPTRARGRSMMGWSTHTHICQLEGGRLVLPRRK
jgi:hypothetical protein